MTAPGKAERQGGWRSAHWEAGQTNALGGGKEKPQGSAPDPARGVAPSTPTKAGPWMPFIGSGKKGGQPWRFNVRVGPLSSLPQLIAVQGPCPWWVRRAKPSRGLGQSPKAFFPSPDCAPV